MHSGHERVREELPREGARGVAESHAHLSRRSVLYTAAPRENDKLLRRSEEEKQKLLADGMRDAADGGWVVEGVFGELVDVATAAAGADCTLLWLNIPWQVCQVRIHARPQNLAGAGGADSAEMLAKLDAWAKAYWTRDDKRSATGHAAMLKAHAEQGRPVRELSSEDDVAAFLSRVRDLKSAAAAEVKWCFCGAHLRARVLRALGSRRHAHPLHACNATSDAAVTCHAGVCVAMVVSRLNRN